MAAGSWKTERRPFCNSSRSRLRDAVPVNVYTADVCVSACVCVCVLCAHVCLCEHTCGHGLSRLWLKNMSLLSCPTQVMNTIKSPTDYNLIMSKVTYSIIY